MGLIKTNKLFHKEKGVHIVKLMTNDVIIRVEYSLIDNEAGLRQLFIDHDVPEDLVDPLLKACGKKEPTYEGPSGLSQQLPGIKERVKNPVTGREDELSSVIMNLNDVSHWTREQIADWIENTFEVDVIAFKTPGEVPDEAPKLSESSRLVKIERVLPIQA